MNTQAVQDIYIRTVLRFLGNLDDTHYNIVGAQELVEARAQCLEYIQRLLQKGKFVFVLPLLLLTQKKKT